MQPPIRVDHHPANSLRRNLYKILETTTGKKRGLSLVFNLILISVITLNALAIILNTVPSLKLHYDHFFVDFEVFSVIFFTIEYFVRIWICVENEKYRHPVFGRLRYMLSTTAIIHLLAILPFYVTLFHTDLALIRILRIFRIFRLFRITRYSRAFQVIQSVVEDKKEELVLSVSFLMFMLVIISSVMYYLEHAAQPDKFSSIPATLWWGINAMATVGYGDIHPMTTMGKMLAGITAVLGIGLFALPTGILASGFAEHIRSQKAVHKPHCPHCGKEL
ncbi:ion transporter [Larkinella rosea]|uniref:Ion transporter n=1 Tax=Larkinella rosea TaxID=2025312 RepID=A0A3P1BMF8_9BACT|nr:ion transporter [Larkinella rosea]RRB02218.1 ion transporter [Larkinella rosea]